MSNPSRRTIIAALRNGDRHPSEDADEIACDNPYSITFVHHARDGNISLEYALSTASENTEAGGAYGFELLEEDET